MLRDGNSVCLSFKSGMYIALVYVCIFKCFCSVGEPKAKAAAVVRKSFSHIIMTLPTRAAFITTNFRLAETVDEDRYVG